MNGALIEPLGAFWGAYSPLSGETALINDESAAILEVLQAGPLDAVGVAAELAADAGLTPAELQPMVEAHWPQLLETGLVQPLAGSGGSGFLG